MPQAMAIRGNTILAVDLNAEIKQLKVAITIITNLRDRTLTPGIIDTHIYAIRDAQGFTLETCWYQQD